MTPLTRPPSERKLAALRLADEQADRRDAWIERNSFYYANDRRYMRSVIPPGLRVLELGCGTGGLLAQLEPAQGVGVDASSKMIAVARKRHPDLEFRQGDIEDPTLIEGLDGPFDAIVLSDTLGALDDCQQTLASLHPLCSRQTRLIVAHYSSFWEPILRLGEAVGIKTPTTGQNWLSTSDISRLLDLVDFDVIRTDWKQLVPKRLLGLGPLINCSVATLPGIRGLCLRHYVVARSLMGRVREPVSATVVVPCRNEKGNVATAIERIPSFCEQQDILFVEGHSQDGTWEEIERVIAEHPELAIKAIRQPGVGKADAVWAAFDQADGDILMILDGDLTTPPESLPKFYEALIEGKGEFLMGTRFVYPAEQEAMRFLNFWANRTFAAVFSWLLHQRITDTLCGTKVITKSAYHRFKTLPSRVEDPFGDFDLIFGAAALNLKILEIPVRYAARDYGETQISRFRHGMILARMVLVAFRKEIAR